MIKLVIISFHSKEQHSKNVSFSFATKCQEESIPELVWQLHDALRGLDFPSLPSLPFLARRFCSHGYKTMAPISGIIYIPGRMEGTKSSVKNSWLLSSSLFIRKIVALPVAPFPGLLICHRSYSPYQRQRNGVSYLSLHRKLYCFKSWNHKHLLLFLWVRMELEVESSFPKGERSASPQNNTMQPRHMNSKTES